MYAWICVRIHTIDGRCRRHRRRRRTRWIPGASDRSTHKHVHTDLQSGLQPNESWAFVCKCLLWKPQQPQPQPSKCKAKVSFVAIGRIEDGKVNQLNCCCSCGCCCFCCCCFMLHGRLGIPQFLCASSWVYAVLDSCACITSFHQQCRQQRRTAHSCNFCTTHSRRFWRWIERRREGSSCGVKC